MKTLWISWSSLRVHEECKQKGKLHRAGSKASLENIRMFLPGTVTDRVVRDWLADDPLQNKGAMPDMVHDWIERAISEEGRGVVAWKNPEDRKRVEADCIEAVTKIEPSLLKYVVPFEYQPDYSFRTPLNIPVYGKGYSQQVILNGAMDILVRDDKGRWFIFDVKHTRDDSYYKKTAGQMMFYDFVNEITHGSATEKTALLQPLCKEKVKVIPIDPTARAGIMQRIAGMANDIWNEDFAPREDNKICGFCNVKHACPKFTPVRDSQGKNRVSF